MTRPDLPTLRTLRDRIAAATGPDRELDVAICVAFQFVGPDCPVPLDVRVEPDMEPDELVYEFDDGDGYKMPWACYAPNLTASLDAVAALAERLLPGDGWTLWTTSGRWHAHFFEIKTSANAATAPLALLGAVLDRLVKKQEAARD